MRSVVFGSLALLAALAVVTVVGCSERLTVPTAPPAEAQRRDATAAGANRLFGQATNEEPSWPGVVQWTEAETAVDSLGRIGPKALPALVELLSGQDERLRAAAARAIAIMGPPAKDAVPDLTAALSDPSSRVRKYALRALGQMGEASESAIDAITRETHRPSSPLDQEIERERRPPAGVIRSSSPATALPPDAP
jgi:hypothetical protein